MSLWQEYFGATFDWIKQCFGVPLMLVAGLDGSSWTSRLMTGKVITGRSSGLLDAWGFVQAPWLSIIWRWHVMMKWLTTVYLHWAASSVRRHSQTVSWPIARTNVHTQPCHGMHSHNTITSSRAPMLGIGLLERQALLGGTGRRLLLMWQLVEVVLMFSVWLVIWGVCLPCGTILSHIHIHVPSQSCVSLLQGHDLSSCRYMNCTHTLVHACLGECRLFALCEYQYHMYTCS
jgi:hypothetical protein